MGFLSHEDRRPLNLTEDELREITRGRMYIPAGAIDAIRAMGASETAKGEAYGTIKTQKGAA